MQAIGLGVRREEVTVVPLHNFPDKPPEWCLDNAMIYGHLQHPDAFAPLLANPVWKEAFDWFAGMAASESSFPFLMQPQPIF